MTKDQTGLGSKEAIAALYDIHGNLPALEAALAAVESAGAREIVIGGDVVLGPMPCQALERLLALEPRARSDPRMMRLPVHRRTLLGRDAAAVPHVGECFGTDAAGER